MNDDATGAADRAGGGIPAAAIPADELAGDAVPNQAGGEFAAAAATASAPAAIALGYEHPSASSLFSVGTLVYTSGGIALLFFWLLWGDFALSMRERSVGPVIQLFVRSQHASDFAMTVLLVALPQAISLLLSPIVSYRSDRLRSRWGRRIPYLLVPTPIAALAMIGIAFSPRLGAALSAALGGRLAPDRATLAVFTPLWVAFEVAVIVSGSVLGGLINDVVPRGRLGRFYAMFRAVSLADGFVFNWFLLKFAESHFTLMFAWIGIVFGVGFAMMCLNVREGTYPPPAAFDANDVRAGGFVAAVRTYLRECFNLPYYRRCFTMFTLANLTFMPANLFAIYYRDQIGLSLATFGKVVGGCYLASIGLAYPIGALADRIGPMRVAMTLLAAYGAAMFAAFFFVVGPVTFAIATVIHTVSSGSYFTAAQSLPNALLPRSRFAQFSSASGVFNSLATMAVGPALGLTMTLTGRYYRMTWLLAALFAAGACALMWRQYCAFERLGGRVGYVAPGDEGDVGALGFPVVVKGH